MEKEDNILKNSKGISKISLIITIIAVVIVIAIIIIVTIVLMSNKKESNPKQAEETVQTQIESGEDSGSTNREIAKILFEAFFKGEIDEAKISEAEYDSKNQEFSCTYIIEQFEEPYKKNDVTISTNDFVTYRYAKTEYEDDVPNTHNDVFKTLLNDKKNEIISLAQNEGYYTGKNLSNEDFAKIFQTIFQNDTNNLQQIIQQNGYILKSYCMYDQIIEFDYIQSDNDENYIIIESMLNSVSEWKVWGGSDKPIYEGEEYSDIAESYIFDYKINIKNNLEEIEAIFNKTKELSK